MEVKTIDEALDITIGLVKSTRLPVDGFDDVYAILKTVIRNLEAIKNACTKQRNTEKEVEPDGLQHDPSE